MNKPTSPATRHVLALLLLSVVTTTLLSPAVTQAQRNRDSWQRVPEVLSALAIDKGSRVADIGAGDGYFTRHLAQAVGSSGQVFAVEINQRALSRLRRLASDEGFDNIEVVEGEIDDPKLPKGSLDAVLV